MIGFYNYTIILTCIGTLSGVFGIFSSILGFTGRAVIFLMISGLCDMFDGRIARTRDRSEQEKKFGIQLDSLSDIICFGVLPVAIGYSIILRQYIPNLDPDSKYGLFVNPIPTWVKVVYMTVGVIFTLAALIRLAYFNVTEDERQAECAHKPRKYYDGLPVTSVALILPILYLFRNIKALGECFYIIYMAALFIISILFIIKIKVKKPGLREMIGFMIVGALVMALMLVL